MPWVCDPPSWSVDGLLALALVVYVIASAAHELVRTWRQAIQAFG